MSAKTLILHLPSSETLRVNEGATIGRAADNDLVLDDRLTSRHHARIERLEDDEFLVIDLGSSNGTRLNDDGLNAPARLGDRDVLRIGSVEIGIEIEGGRKPPAPDAPEDATATGTLQQVGRGMIGTSRSMLEVFRLIGIAGQSRLPVLIEGETGTGKELTAKAVHDASPRAKKPFLAINCATLVEGLLESELFGHRKGAFTGADRDHPGLFETANGGTVFLDEIGEMPLATQPKLLRVLEENEVVRVGETRARPIDVRIVSATNRDLEASVSEGGFRGDLFFRLATFPLKLPPLRDRDGDVPLLVRYAISNAAQKSGKRVSGTTPEADVLLEKYDWPGNARELRNEMLRAVELVAEGEPIDARHLSERVQRGPGAAAASQPPPAAAPTPKPAPAGAPSATDTVDAGEIAQDLREARAAWEADHIRRVLEENEGHIGKTAEALGLSRTALYKKFREYGI